MPRFPLLLPALLAALAAVPLARAAVDPARLQAARALYEQNQLAEAQTAFAALAAEDPNFGAAQRYLGLLALRRGDADAAVKFSERAQVLEPASARAWHQLGDAFGLAAMKAGVLSKFGWAKKCKAAYEKAVALEPTNIGYRWSLMEYCKQAPSLVGGSFAQAHEQADAILALNPRAGRFAKAGVLAAEKKVAEAFAPYADVLTAASPDYGALVQFGQLTLITGQRRADGLLALQKCLSLPPPSGEPGHPTIHFLCGLLCEKAGDKAAARAAYRAALALDTGFTPAAEALKKLQ